MKPYQIVFSFFLLFAFCIEGVFAAESSIQSHVINLAAVNDEWTSTGLKVSSQDMVIISLTGSVKVGEFVGEISAANTVSPSNYFVEGKIGSSNAPFRVAPSVAFTPNNDSPATLKIRFHDTKYSDNSGSFTVKVYVIPYSALPEPTLFNSDE